MVHYNSFPNSLSDSIFHLKLVVTIGFLSTIPLVHDVFRNAKVEYYTRTVAVLTSLFYLYLIIIGNGNILFNIFFIIVAALIVLFSTKWHRFIRIFYGILTTLGFLFLLLFIYAYTYGHYGVNPLEPGNLSLGEIIPVAAAVWLLIRSWCRSTYRQ